MTADVITRGGPKSREHFQTKIFLFIDKRYVLNIYLNIDDIKNLVGLHILH